MVNVVIVEDEPNEAKLLRNYPDGITARRGEKFSVSVYGDAETFLVNYRHDTDIVFMDIELPDMNGMEAARNAESKVIMYADVMTGSMERAIKETDRRREKQQTYNREHNITPRTIVKKIANTLEITTKAAGDMRGGDIGRQIESLQGLMKTASAALDFETAIKLRDRIAELKKLEREINKSKNR